MPKLNIPSGGGVIVISCNRCAPHQLAATLDVDTLRHLDGVEIYTLQTTLEEAPTIPVLVHYDIGRALRLIAARPAGKGHAPRRADPAWIQWWCTEKADPDWAHVTHLPDAALDQPGLVMWNLSTDAPGASPGNPKPFPVLIDGIHRWHRLRQLGQLERFTVIDLVADEVDAVMSLEAGSDPELQRAWTEPVTDRSVVLDMSQE